MYFTTTFPNKFSCYFVSFSSSLCSFDSWTQCNFTWMVLFSSFNSVIFILVIVVVFLLILTVLLLWLLLLLSCSYVGDRRWFFFYVLFSKILLCIFKIKWRWPTAMNGSQISPFRICLCNALLCCQHKVKNCFIFWLSNNNSHFTSRQITYSRVKCVKAERFYIYVFIFFFS